MNGAMGKESRPTGRGWAWALLALLGSVVMVETVALAVLASLLSLVVAVAIPVVVIVLAVLITVDARRHWVDPRVGSVVGEHIAADIASAPH